MSELPDGLTMTVGGSTVLIVEETHYSFGSADNLRCYPQELLGGRDSYTAYGIIVDGEPRAVVGGVGGPTRLHRYSALVLDERLYLVVGDAVACIQPSPFALVWSLQADVVTCFGLHWSAQHEAIISHGELAISRLSKDGTLLWETPGRDIFTGPFRLAPQWIEAEDFEGGAYRIAYNDGQLISGP